MPGSLQLGRIVWAEIADTNGIPKLRPVVIVIPSDQITPAAPLDIIAVTSRVPEPLPHDHVLLPGMPKGIRGPGSTASVPLSARGWLVFGIYADILSSTNGADTRPTPATPAA